MSVSRIVATALRLPSAPRLASAAYRRPFAWAANDPFSGLSRVERQEVLHRCPPSRW